MMTALPSSDPRTDGPTAPGVQVLICGAEDRGDDAAAIVAARDLVERLPAGVGIRLVGQLGVEDLLHVPADHSVVIVDAAAGVPPGTIVDLPIDGLARMRTCRPRSTHALAAREVIGLAGLLRSEPLNGRIVAIGGERFELGTGLSGRVAGAIPDLVAAILDAIADLLRT
jgi:hydrogenase maturation protease